MNCLGLAFLCSLSSNKVHKNYLHLLPDGCSQGQFSSSDSGKEQASSSSPYDAPILSCHTKRQRTWCLGNIIKTGNNKISRFAFQNCRTQLQESHQLFFYIFYIPGPWISLDKIKYYWRVIIPKSHQLPGSYTVYQVSLHSLTHFLEKKTKNIQ